MINLKNSLKKTLAGAFGVITMLSPFQNAQCANMYKYEDIARENGLDAGTLADYEILAFEWEAECRNVTINVSASEIYGSILKAAKPIKKTSDVEKMLNHAIPIKLRLSKGSKKRRAYTNKYFCLSVKEEILSLISSLYRSLFDQECADSAVKSLVDLKILMDYVQEKLSIKEKTIVFFNDERSHANILYAPDGDDSDDPLKLLSNLHTPDEKDDICGAYKEFSEYLSDEFEEEKVHYRKLVKTCKKLIENLVMELTKIYEECDASAASSQSPSSSSSSNSSSSSSAQPAEQTPEG